MIFVKEIVIQTKLSKEEIIDRINGLLNPKHKWCFEGEVGKNGFIIEPLYGYTPRNRIRAEVTGVIIPKSGFTIVKLNCHLSLRYKVLFVAATILNLTVTLLDINDPEIFPFPWWSIPLAFVFTFFMFLLKFNSTTETVIKVLRNVLKN
jgi:hypothetical protein